jgi:Ser/Thr protein kinase RdoA (MazF antagonist)
VLPISELVRVASALDSRWSSPLALEAARHWGYDCVRFVRSSATHVFWCGVGGAADFHGDAVVRLVPHAVPSSTSCADVALLSRALASAGGPVAPAIATDDGCWTVDVHDGGESYTAACYDAAPGARLEESQLSASQANAWGRALAALHEAGTRAPSAISTRLPDWHRDHVAGAIAALAGTELAACATEVGTWLDGLPKGRDVHGLVHGDPELDNTIWDGGSPTFVDFDEAAHSWFAADIGFALRDFASPAQGPDPSDPLVASFLAGYRTARPLPDAQIGWLPMFARAHALVTVAGLVPLLAEKPGADWPDWAQSLHQRLRALVDELSAQLR